MNIRKLQLFIVENDKGNLNNMLEKKNMEILE